MRPENNDFLPLISPDGHGRRGFSAGPKECGRLRELLPQHRRLAPLLVSAALAVMTAAANAPTLLAQTPEESNFNLEGKINSVEEGKLTVHTEENILFHVRYNDKTEIKRSDGSAGKAKEFHVGLKVQVEGNLTESGEIIAKTITILPEGKPQKFKLRAGQGWGAH